jgi:hypothetical protein
MLGREVLALPAIAAVFAHIVRLDRVQIGTCVITMLLFLVFIFLVMIIGLLFIKYVIQLAYLFVKLVWQLLCLFVRSVELAENSRTRRR